MGAFHREQHTAKFNTHQLLLLPLRPLRPLRSLRPLRLKPFGCGSPRCGEELDLSHGTSLWKDAQGLIAACIYHLGSSFFLKSGQNSCTRLKPASRTRLKLMRLQMGVIPWRSPGTYKSLNACDIAPPAMREALNVLCPSSAWVITTRLIEYRARFGNGRLGLRKYRGSCFSSAGIRNC